MSDRLSAYVLMVIYLMLAQLAQHFEMPVIATFFACCGATAGLRKLG